MHLPSPSLARRAVARLLALAVAAAALATPAAAQGDADLQALERYRLTTANLDRFEQASRNMAAAMKDPAVRAEVQRQAEQNEQEEEPRSIAELAARVDRMPAAKQAIAKAGMTTQEYITFQLSLLQAAMAAAMMEQMQSTEVPQGTPKENVEFVRANKARLDRLGAELKAMQPEEAEPAEPGAR